MRIIEVMFRCASCGAQVSEWAARCAVCAHDTNDAVEIREDTGSEGFALVEDVAVATAGRSDSASPVSTLSAGRISWRRKRLLMATAAVMVVAAGTTTAVAVSSSGDAAPAWLQALSGRVVAESPQGSVVTVAPDGSDERRITAGPRIGQLFLPSADWTAAADRRLLASVSGGPLGGPIVIPINGGAVASRPEPTVGALATLRVAQAVSFADHDNVLIVLPQTSSQSGASVLAVTLKSGAEVSLGPADTVSGDPAGIGAFASVPAPTAQLSREQAAPVDTAVELLRSGHPSVTLATTAELNIDTGRLPTTPTQLSVFADPAGGKVAVVLNPPALTGVDVPMVILDRHGRLLGPVAESDGPAQDAQGAQPTWSPDGRQLAYPTYTSTGPAIAIQTLNGQTEAYPLPNSNARVVACTWSPSSSAVVCQTQTGSRFRWEFVDLTTGAVATSASPGYPLTWLPSH